MLIRSFVLLAALSLSLPTLAQSPDLTARAAANKKLFEAAQPPSSAAIPATRYTVLKSGPASGRHPTRASAIKVRYEGSFLDGSIFDSSVKEPDGAAIFPLRMLIPGFVSAVMLMRPGDEWLVYIPPEMAYGSEGHELAGKGLFFKIGLVDFAELPPYDSPVMKELPKPAAK